MRHGYVYDSDFCFQFDLWHCVEGLVLVLLSLFLVKICYVGQAQRNLKFANTNYSDIKYTIFSTLFLCPRPQRRPHTPHATDEQKIGHSASQASKGQLTKIRDTIRAFVPTMQSARNKGATALKSLKNMKDAIVVKANENSTWLSIFTSLVTTAYVLHTILPMIILAFVVLAVVFYDHRSTRLSTEL